MTGDSVTADGLPRAGQYAGCVEQVYTWLRRHPLLVDGALAAGLLASVPCSAAAGFAHRERATRRGTSRSACCWPGLVLVRRKHPAAAFAVAMAIAAILVALGTDLRASECEWALLGGHGAALHPGRLPPSADLLARPSRCAWPSSRSAVISVRSNQQAQHSRHSLGRARARRADGQRLDARGLRSLPARA